MLRGLQAWTGCSSAPQGLGDEGSGVRGVLDEVRVHRRLV